MSGGSRWSRVGEVGAGGCRGPGVPGPEGGEGPGVPGRGGGELEGAGGRRMPRLGGVPRLGASLDRGAGTEVPGLAGSRGPGVRGQPCRATPGPRQPCHLQPGPAGPGLRPALPPTNPATPRATTAHEPCISGPRPASPASREPIHLRTSPPTNLTVHEPHRPRTRHRPQALPATDSANLNNPPPSNPPPNPPPTYPSRSRPPARCRASPRLHHATNPDLNRRCYLPPVPQ